MKWSEKTARWMCGALAAGLVAVGVGAASAQEACRVYSNRGFNGFVEAFGDGQAARRLGLFLDRKVSSISVAPGCEVTLYKGREFSGEEITYDRSEERLPGEWNDRARSVLCECGRRGGRGDRGGRGGRGDGDRADEGRGGGDRGGRGGRDRDFDGRGRGRDGEAPRLRADGAACIAYEDRRYRGRWRSFANGDRRERLGRRLNEKVSSIEVANGCRAVLDFEGEFRLTVTGNLDRLPRGLEDRATEMTCRCGR